ncbi:MAG: YjjG family noncanonical pyrimidine nucleotidase, partial [Bacteroidota bacterium]
RTLWDFERNSMETFRELFKKHNLQTKGVPSLEEFLNTYRPLNLELWEEYKKEKITKDFLKYRRFEVTLNEFGIDDLSLAKAMGEDYVALSPMQNHLIPGSVEIIEYLFDRYSLHIITNGFEEVQNEKMIRKGLGKYFKTTIVSEEAGSKKPEPGIFQYALNKAQAKAFESLMIGDDAEVDIRGALNAGIDQVYFNPDKLDCPFRPTYTVNHLLELKDFL